MRDTKTKCNGQDDEDNKDDKAEGDDSDAGCLPLYLQKVEIVRKSPSRLILVTTLVNSSRDTTIFLLHTLSSAPICVTLFSMMYWCDDETAMNAGMLVLAIMWLFRRCP